jgi:hypothetical protein
MVSCLGFSNYLFFFGKHKGAITVFTPFLIVGQDGRLKIKRRQDYLPQMLWHEKDITKRRMLLWQ